MIIKKVMRMGKEKSNILIAFFCNFLSRYFIVPMFLELFLEFVAGK